MIETQEREAELQRLNDENKMKLLDSLADEESRKEAEIIELQKKKETERKYLNDRMWQAEQQSDYLIKELMESNQRFSDPSSVMKALEEDKKKMEQQFTILAEDAERLREADIRRKTLFDIGGGGPEVVVWWCLLFTNISQLSRFYATNDGGGDAEKGNH